MGVLSWLKQPVEKCPYCNKWITKKKLRDHKKACKKRKKLEKKKAKREKRKQH